VQRERSTAVPAHDLGRRSADWLLIVVFGAALALPITGRLLGWAAPYDPALEKRPAAMWPKMEYGRLGPLPRPLKRSLVMFPNRFEAFFNDNYGFRVELLRTFSQARIADLVPSGLERPAGTGQTCHGVVIGNNGWLYLDGESIDTYRAVRPFTAGDLDAWETSLRERRDWLAARGIRYLFFIAPEKPTIYPEHLPATINRVGKATRFDQLAGRISDQYAADFLDLRSLLLAAKAERPIYYQIDTHWNAYGAWLAYQQVIERLQTWFPRLQPQSLDAYELARGRMRGDLETILPTSNWPEENAVDLNPKQPLHSVRQDELLDAGNGKYVAGSRSRNPDAAPGKALVIHDSFFLAMIPFFAEHWREVVYVHNDHGFPADLIERERPDVVIYETVERKLFNRPPHDGPLPPISGNRVWAERAPGALRR
jgi:hypothetical protein